MSREKHHLPDVLTHFGAGSNVSAYIDGLSPDGEERGRVLHVPLRDIAPAPWQPRVYESPERMEELMESIERHGMLHPVTVRPCTSRLGITQPFRYEVVAGHRRLEAVKRLAQDEGGGHAATVPVLVRELDDLEARLLTHVENLDREDLCAWETARSIESVRAALAAAAEPHDVRSVAERVARAAGTTSEYLQVASAATEALLRAGTACTPDGDLDVALVHRMTKDDLLRIAKASEQARPAAMRALVDRLRRVRPSVRRRTARSDSGSPDALAAGRPAPRPPRFSVDQLREHGRFTMNLRKPFSEYGPDEAQAYLADLLPALAVLGDIAAGDRPWLLSQAGHGFVLYVRRSCCSADSSAFPAALLDFVKSACGAIEPEAEVEQQEERAGEQSA